MNEDKLNGELQEENINGVQPDLNSGVNVENQNISTDNLNVESPVIVQNNNVDNLNVGSMSVDSNINQNIDSNGLNMDPNLNQNVVGATSNTENLVNGQNTNQNIGNVDNVNQGNNQPNNLGNANNTSKAKLKINPIIIGGVVALIIVIIILMKFLGGNKAISKYASYLPKDKSEYDAICVKKDKYEGNDEITMYEVVGMNEIENRYISYSMAVVLTKKDGSAIEENENNKSAADEMKANFESSGYLGVTAGFKDGNLVINYGMSNFTYSKAKDAVKDFEKEGYDCK